MVAKLWIIGQRTLFCANLSKRRKVICSGQMTFLGYILRMKYGHVNLLRKKFELARLVIVRISAFKINHHRVIVKYEWYSELEHLWENWNCKICFQLEPKITVLLKNDALVSACVRYCSFRAGGCHWM